MTNKLMTNKLMTNKLLTNKLMTNKLMTNDSKLMTLNPNPSTDGKLLKNH